MYNTLTMVKTEAVFSVDDLHRLLLGVTATGEASLQRSGNRFHIVSGDGSLDLAFTDAPHVVVESNELAESYDVPCQGCRARLEVWGDDPDMDLFNDYLLIIERLQETGNFVIFDSQECKLMFDDPGK